MRNYLKARSNLSITKLYAINDNKHTILIVSLDSNSLGFIHTDDQQIDKINKIGNIILKIFIYFLQYSLTKYNHLFLFKI